MNQIAAIQMTSTASVQDNLAQAQKLIAIAINTGAQLIVLPEMFATMGMDKESACHVYETQGTGPIQEFLAAQAKQSRAWIIGGTIPLKSDDGERARAACLVFNDKGECVARYDKIHLFDVYVADSRENFQESKRIEPGEQIVVIETPVGKVGLAICYDLRFPELFRLLQERGAEIFALPAAFTVPTGQAHWEILMRSRAIENTCYMVGAAQWGNNSPNRKTFGDSIIIDPWGNILTQLTENTGVINAAINLNYLHEIRRNFPLMQHRKFPISLK